MFGRRSLLRGMVAGSGVVVGLPLLDKFLNTNGTALAAGGALPIRFGTWTWGLGMQTSRWVPKKTGTDFEMPPELAGITDLRKKVAVLSGFSVLTDGRQNKPHTTGAVAIRTGTVPAGNITFEAPTVDVLISDVIGTDTRFKSMEIASTGNPLHTYSARSNSVINAPSVTPIELYQRIFGDEFQDPNSDTFKPSPNIMVRNSVLSAIKEERESFVKELGAADRSRLDQYFTSVRQLEQQLDLQLQKPERLAACKRAGQPEETTISAEVDVIAKNHDLMANLLAMALACNQTKVFNMVFNDFTSTLRKKGASSNHHSISHEESLDPQLGYQVQISWFTEQCMNRFGSFIKILDSIPEGTGTVLDNTVVFAHSDVSYAQVHSLDGIPMMVAGSGGGRVKVGQHIAGGATSAGRVGLTLQQIMKVPVERWGTGSMQTNKPIMELIA